MSEPGLVVSDLDAHAQELDQLSRDLWDTEKRLKGATDDYEAFMAEYEEGLWTRHTTDGEKFPPEALRTRMAHRAMPAELLGRYTNLVAERRRMEKRVSSLKAVVDAKRSILSALKTEMEAVR